LFSFVDSLIVILPAKLRIFPEYPPILIKKTAGMYLFATEACQMACPCSAANRQVVK
jgi:hypothetical protein